MSIEEIEAAALRLDPKERAKLAERLLESLEQLSDEENARLWAEEAERRDRDWDTKATVGRPAREVLRAARAKLKCKDAVSLHAALKWSSDLPASRNLGKMLFQPLSHLFPGNAP